MIYFSKVHEGLKELTREFIDHQTICYIYEKVLEVKIPNSLAEERFENLQLETFFAGLDILVSLLS